jgi:HSP20 family molecular chaperone IbpA
MSSIPHSFLPRSWFNTDNWFKPHEKSVQYSPTTLEIFDPFDELDYLLGRNMMWINKPEFFTPAVIRPKVPQKYRITINTSGFDPKSIKTEFSNNKLVVQGNEETKSDDAEGDFNVRKFKKTYIMPEGAENDKMASFITSDGQMVLEIPLKETGTSKNEDLWPRIVEEKDGSKQVTFCCSVPAEIDTKKVHVTCKDRDVIIKADDVKEHPDGMTRFAYYKRSTLPENTKFDELKCTFDKNMITINAPLDLTYKAHQREVPIETVKENAPVQGVSEEKMAC